MHHRTVVALAIGFAACVQDARAGSPSQPDREALKARCSGDYAIYYGDLPRDGPEVQACFRKNMADLSPACRTEVERHEKSGRRG
ncbi:hypothetical protein [Methylobacterium durans]|uniref:3',5'-cyclic-nucleotide phosphodiesterase n=1 Tax=Methylobacterium durans TaxID=2202825 RepID=A0A2U8WDQ6_9HYPH|nr:hypothetical protein [Methylobacterium durans]AWN43446.1 hypothetical protein DK389_26715 [Methylobacterium durans]